MEFFLFWVIFSIIVAMFAGRRGRSGAGWLLISLLLSPLIAFLLLLVLPSADDKEAAKAQHGLATGKYKKCPFCAELVLQEAVKCKHCGSDLKTA